MHYHYGYHLPSYGVDDPDNIRYAKDEAGLAMQLADDLSRDVDSAVDRASAARDMAKKVRDQPGMKNQELEDLREYLEENERANDLHTLSLNFKAIETGPLYQENPELIAPRVRGLLDKEGWRIEVADNSILSVWECSEDACTQEEDE
jgi:hypothetical protein